MINTDPNNNNNNNKNRSNQQNENRETLNRQRDMDFGQPYDSSNIFEMSEFGNFEQMNTVAGLRFQFHCVCNRKKKHTHKLY